MRAKVASWRIPRFSHAHYGCFLMWSAYRIGGNCRATHLRESWRAAQRLKALERSCCIPGMSCRGWSGLSFCWEHRSSAGISLSLPGHVSCLFVLFAIHFRLHRRHRHRKFLFVKISKASSYRQSPRLLYGLSMAPRHRTYYPLASLHAGDPSRLTYAVFCSFCLIGALFQQTDSRALFGWCLHRTNILARCLIEKES